MELATVHFADTYAYRQAIHLRHRRTGGADTLFRVLQGNPVFGLVGFEVFVRPGAARMKGNEVVDAARARVRFAHDVTPIDPHRLHACPLRPRR